MTDELIAKAEGVLLDLCRKEIAEFSTRNTQEDFYGFAFDCNCGYAQVILCFNSVQCLEYFANNPHRMSGDELKSMQRMYDELGLGKYEETIHSPEELREAYRWNTGDWGYQGTAQDGEHLFRDDWEKLWSPLQNELHGRIVEELGMDSRPWTDRFVEMLYRVLFRLEEEGAFRELRKTPDFRTVILDHDEPDDWPWKRMENMRRKLQHTWPPHQRLT